MTLNIGKSKSGKFTLPLEAVTQTFAILGKRGVGKTHCAGVLVEEMLSCGSQVIVIDPLDVWWGLRSAADGKAAGLPIVIVGGEHGDIPLTGSSGEVLADFLVENNVSAVISTRHMSKNDQRNFVAIFCERLYRRKGEVKNRTPLHICIDEADEFAPQRLYHGAERMFGAVDTLVRRGRSSGIGVTLISQRSAAIHKDCLTQAEVLISFRTISPQDRSAVESWIEAHDAHDQREEFMESLASLEIGTAWFWSPGWLDCFDKVCVRKRHTFDSSATPKMGKIAVAPKQLADVDIAGLTAKMSATIEQKKAEDPRELKKRIAELEKQLKHPPKATPISHDSSPAVLRELLMISKRLDLMQQKVHKAMADSQNIMNSSLSALTGDIREIIESLSKKTKFPSQLVSVPMPRPPLIGKTETHPPLKAARAVLCGSLSRCETAILTGLVQYGEKCTKRRIALITEYSVNSGGFNNAMSKLSSSGYIARNGDSISITQSGIDALGELPEPLPTGGALIGHWINKLSTCEGAILKVLCDSHPNPKTKSEIADLTNYSSNSGGFNNALCKLRTLELVEGYREIKASDELF